MLYRQNCISIQRIDNLPICYMEKYVFPIQHINKFSICCMSKNISSIQHMKNLLICCMNNLSICHIEKDISDDTEQVHNESINMNYLRKRYMNIAPRGHTFSYT